MPVHKRTERPTRRCSEQLLALAPTPFATPVLGHEASLSLAPLGVMHTMRSLLLAICLLAAFVGALHGANPDSKLLLGRWRAETVESGYWIIDRYPDGRFAEKIFLTFDYSKPSEIVVSWGRWKLRGKRYLDIIDGSTSAVVRRFVGKWRTRPVGSLSAQRFKFLSSDGYPRHELPEAGTEPLVDLVLTPPPDLRGPNRNILEADLRAVPAWVNSHP